MQCPYCDSTNLYVTDSRPVGNNIRRRRKCDSCGKRFSTYEKIEHVNWSFETIRKRDGREVQFDETKITDAILKAAKAVGGTNKEIAVTLTDEVIELLKNKHKNSVIGVEDIQDAVEKVLIEAGHAKTAKAYILYRDKRTRIRETKSDLMDAVKEILEEAHKENANMNNSPSSKILQIASAASKQYYLNNLIPENFAQAHIRGDFHIHDLDYYAKTLNCLQIDLVKLLAHGFDNGHGYIRRPKYPISATALTAIIIQSSQNDMYGGQSIPFFDHALAPFMEGASDREMYQAMKALVYNLNSMHSRAGNQVPFSSINMGTATTKTGRRIIYNLLKAYEMGLGRGEQPVWPNIIFRVKEGVNYNPGDPNYDLFQYAIRVAAKRMNPTFSFMDSSFNKEYGDQVAYMGCRTRVIANRRGDSVTAGRGNIAATTINLPRLAILAEKSMAKFYNELGNLMSLAIRQLYHRFETLCTLKVKDLPFVMGQGLYLGSDKLSECDSIKSAMVNGTLSVGFIGLAETLQLLCGKHHGESEEAQKRGIDIVNFMHTMIKNACDKYNLNFTLLATPAEGLSGRFVTLDRKEFGIIFGVTDKEYYTNSFHVPVDFPISSFDKISIEGQYHKYCDAGHITYVEMDAPPVHNPEAVEAIIRHMKDSDIGYAGINFPIDYCSKCGASGVFNEDVCPRCESTSIRRIRRITGYLSTVDRFNDAKIAELNDRVVHS